MGSNRESSVSRATLVSAVLVAVTGLGAGAWWASVSRVNESLAASPTTQPPATSSPSTLATPRNTRGTATTTTPGTGTGDPTIQPVTKDLVEFLLAAGWDGPQVGHVAGVRLVGTGSTRARCSGRQVWALRLPPSRQDIVAVVSVDESDRNDHFLLTALTRPKVGNPKKLGEWVVSYKPTSIKFTTSGDVEIQLAGRRPCKSFARVRVARSSDIRHLTIDNTGKPQKQE